MEKQCCDKVKNNKLYDTCIKCIENLAGLAESVGYDREQWSQDAIEQIPTEEMEFYCIYLKKLNEIVLKVLTNYSIAETELTNLLNDIWYALHDIQAPVRSITNFSKIILDKHPDCDEKTLDYLHRIYDASENMRYMIDDMRDIMVLGRKKEESKNILDFQQIITDVKNNIHNVISEKNAIISIDTNNAPIFKSNILRWTRVFQNLIINSITYNKSDTPIIKIWFDNNNIFIQDNGMGIPEGKTETIFELFTRLSDRNEMSSGTGAGLFMCRKFLSMDGFTISVHKTDDSGSIFVISSKEQQIY